MNKGDNLSSFISSLGDVDEYDSNQPDDMLESWGLSFGALTERDLSDGFIIKTRLVKLLDHPNLQNHLLKMRNLVSLLVSRSILIDKVRPQSV